MSEVATNFEFRCAAEPVWCKLYRIGMADTEILGEALIFTEIVDPEADEIGRWRAQGFPVSPATTLIGDVHLIARDASLNIIADERYTVTASNVGGIIQPWSEAKPLFASDLVVNVNAAAVGSRQRSSSNALMVFLRDQGSISLPVVDADKAPVDLSSEVLEFVVADYEWNAETEVLTETVLATVENANLTVGGTNDNVVTFDVPLAAVAKLGQFAWSLRRVSDGYVFGAGEWAVSYAPGGD